MSRSGRCELDGGTRARRDRGMWSKGAQFLMRWRTVLAAVGAAALTATSVSVLTGSAAQAQPFGFNQLNKIQKRLVSGTLAAALDGTDAAATARTRAAMRAQRVSPTSDACTHRFGTNVKVNQN